MNDWSFRRRQGVCSGCEHAFADGERHTSTLTVREDEILREDLCRACWEERDPEHELFWWRTRHVEGKKKGLALDVEALMGLFLQLEGREEPNLRELRYVLCLLLMRKRRLKIERILRNRGGEAMLVRRPRHEEELEVFVFDFTPERIEQLSSRLRRVFEGGTDLEDESADAGEPAGEAEPGPGGDEAEAPREPEDDQPRGAGGGANGRGAGRVEALDPA